MRYGGAPNSSTTGVPLIMSSRSHVLASIALIGTLWSSSVLAADLASLVNAPEVVSAFSARQDISYDLKVRERYQFYDISGKTPSELRNQIKQNGTKWNDGNVYSGLTTWDIKYRYDISHDNGRCFINSATTKVDILYRLPRLLSAGSDPELTVLWSNYLGHLTDHEFGHKDLAVKTASEINEMLASLGSFSSEDELEAEVRRRAGEKFKRLKEVQVEYDHETRHGETQGAILPSSVVALSSSAGPVASGEKEGLQKPSL